MTDTEAGSRRVAIAGVVTLAIVAVVGFVLLTGDDAGQRAAAGVVMAGAVALGVIEGYRNRTALALVGAVGLIAGGAYGLFLSIAGRDPFTDHVVLGLVVVGLVLGLFTTDGDDESGDDQRDESGDDQRDDPDDHGQSPDEGQAD